MTRTVEISVFGKIADISDFITQLPEKAKESTTAFVIEMEVISREEWDIILNLMKIVKTKFPEIRLDVSFKETETDINLSLPRLP